MTDADVRRFMFQQGPGKRLLGEQNLVDDATPTTSRMPASRARPDGGELLPAATFDLLAAVPFGARRAGSDTDPLGRALITAFGLQRREASHAYADHRSVASGRAKYPVHAFVAERDRWRYLDVYRHQLLPVDATAPTGTRVALAARYSDLPAAYGRLRFAVCETEIGIGVRALCAAADVWNLNTRLDLDASAVAAASAMIAAADAEVWSTPVVVHVGIPGVGAPGPTGPDRPVAPTAPGPTVREAGSARTADDPSMSDIVAVSRLRQVLQPAGPTAATGFPAAIPTTAAPRRDAVPSWAEVIWSRSAGRVPGQRYGFALRPDTIAEHVIAEMVDWLRVPPPHPRLVAVGEHIRVHAALQHVTGRPTGHYEIQADGDVRLVRADSRIMTTIGHGFGRPNSPTTDIGLRHASTAWLFTTDMNGLIDAHGPAASSLLQLWCGWAIHGLCLAAASHGLIARPARSYDEYLIQPIFGLNRRETAVFMTICGRSRFIEPMLDLRP